MEMLEEKKSESEAARTEWEEREHDSGALAAKRWISKPVWKNDEKTVVAAKMWVWLRKLASKGKSKCWSSKEAMEDLRGKLQENRDEGTMVPVWKLCGGC